MIQCRCIVFFNKIAIAYADVVIGFVEGRISQHAIPSRLTEQTGRKQYKKQVCEEGFHEENCVFLIKVQIFQKNSAIK